MAGVQTWGVQKEEVEREMGLLRAPGRQGLFLTGVVREAGEGMSQSPVWNGKIANSLGGGEDSLE